MNKNEIYLIKINTPNGVRISIPEATEFNTQYYLTQNEFNLYRREGIPKKENKGNFCSKVFELIGCTECPALRESVKSFRLPKTKPIGSIQELSFYIGAGERTFFQRGPNVVKRENNVLNIKCSFVKDPEDMPVKVRTEGTIEEQRQVLLCQKDRPIRTL